MEKEAQAKCTEDASSPKPLDLNFPAMTPGTAGAPRRVIRKMVVLDPNKIKKLGLEQKIIQAMNKLSDFKSNTSKNEQINPQPLETTTIITESSKTEIIPKIKSSVKVIAETANSQILSVEEIKPGKVLKPSEKSNEQPQLTSSDVKSLLSKTLLERAAQFKKRANSTKVLNVPEQQSTEKLEAKVGIGLERITHLKPTVVPAVEKVLGNVVEDVNIVDGFRGFTNQEIDSGCHALRRLSLLIERSDSERVDRIPSFSNLQTYLTLKKHIPPEIENNGDLSNVNTPESLPLDKPIEDKNISQEINFNCVLVGTESTAITTGEVLETDANKETNELKPPVANSVASISTITSKLGRRRQVPVTILNLGKRAKSVSLPKPTIQDIKEEQESTPNTIEITSSIIKCSEESDPTSKIILPLPVASSEKFVNNSAVSYKPRHTSNKEIIVLEEKVFKPGVIIPNLSNSSTNIIQGLNSIKGSCPKSGNRTIFLKVLNRNPVSNEIQIEVVDPLLNIAQAEKAKHNPISSICKSYAKRMMKTGIKQIQIKSNDPEQLQTSFAASEYYVSQAQSPLFRDSDMLNESQLSHNSEDKPEVLFTIECLRDEQNISNDNKNVKLETKDTHVPTPAEEMDAVEYILNCSKNNTVENTTSAFDDEEDLYNADWDDADDSDDDSEWESFDDETEQAKEEDNTQPTDLVEQLEVANTKSISIDKKPHTQNQHNNMYQFAVNTDVITMIQQAEITFEPDLKPVPELMTVIDIVRTAPKCSTSQITESTSSNTGNTQIKQEMEKDNPSVSNCYSMDPVPSNECTVQHKILSPKKRRKRTILDYMTTLKSNSVSTVKSEQVERTNSANPESVLESLRNTAEDIKPLTTSIGQHAVLESAEKPHLIPDSTNNALDISQDEVIQSICDNTIVNSVFTDSVDEISTNSNRINSQSEGNREELISNSSIETILNSRSLEGSVENMMGKGRKEESRNDGLLEKANANDKNGKDLISSDIEKKLSNRSVIQKKIHNMKNRNEPALKKHKFRQNRDEDMQIVDLDESEIYDSEMPDASNGTLSAPQKTLISASSKKGNEDEKVSRDKEEKDCTFTTEIVTNKNAKAEVDNAFSAKDVELSINQKEATTSELPPFDRKSSRIRKPNIKSDFVMETKHNRKDSREPNLKNSTKAIVDERKSTQTICVRRIEDINEQVKTETECQSSGIAGTKIGGTTAKMNKSRRKNTIPEIDKLVLERKSKNPDSDIDGEINQKNSSMKKSSNSVSEQPVLPPPAELKQNNNSQLFSRRRPGRPRKNNSSELPQSQFDLTQTSKRRNSGISEEEPNEKISKVDPDPDDYASAVWRERQISKKKIKRNDSYMHPKLLLVENRADLDNESEITIEEEQIGGRTIKVEPADADLPQHIVRCGTCKQIVSENIFVQHLKRHYGVGWREEKDMPINLSSYREVLNAMVYFMKINKVPSFNCKFCNEEKKSAIGILGHIQTCGLTQIEFNNLLETCETCGKRVLPHLMWPHKKSCKIASESQDVPQDVQAEQSSSTGRTKRKSLLKANSSFKEIMNTSFRLTIDDFVKPYIMPRGGIHIKWKSAINKHGHAKCYEPDCSFESSELDELKTHVKSCIHIRKGGFCCIRCKYYNVEKEAVRKHIQEKHERDFMTLMRKEAEDDEHKDSKKDHDSQYENLDESSGTDEEEVTDENESDRSKDKRKTDVTPIFPNFRRTRLPVRDFVSSTETIRNEIFVEDVALYPYASTQNISVLSESFESFRPANHRSMKFCIKSHLNSKFINKEFGSSAMPQEWLEMDSFQSATHPTEGIIFIGGPITSLAWAPLPMFLGETNCSEYLALTYKYDYNSKVKIIEPDLQRSIILVYRMDTAKDKKSKFLCKPELLYGIPCIGPINHLVFLPSGGYASESNRLGLLAVATVQSNVEIYALPIKAPSNCDTINNDKICNLLDIKPSLVLAVDLSDNLSASEDYMSQCLRIVWSEVKQHNIIGAGYSNGFVGIWDIRDDGNLTKFERNKCRYFVPLTYFRALPNSVSGLKFHYNTEGPRWLAVTSHVRELRAYDLDDLSNPILLSQEQGLKSSLSDILWPIYSENPIVSMDDDYVEDSCTAITKSLLNVTYKIRHNLHSPTGINALTFSPWHNALIGACDNGDIVLQKFKTVSMENISVNTYATRYVYYSDIIRLDGKPIQRVNQKTVKEGLDEIALATLDSFQADYKDIYGLVFGGPITCDRNNVKDTQSVTRVPPFSIRPLTKVKCIEICPNRLNNNLLAIGHNNGFVRIKLLEFRSF